MNSIALGPLEAGVILAVFLLWLGTVLWAGRDARRRGRSGLLVALLVALLAWPLGLLAWLIFRPASRAAAGDRRG